MKIFVNFNYKNVPYGGGNQFVAGFANYTNEQTDIELVFTLEPDIDIYLLIDLRHGGEFKKYSFETIYKHKQKYSGKIVYRVNDCDITRENKSLENILLANLDKIDYLIFVSNFIRNYYTGKYPQVLQKDFDVVYNSADRNIFYPKDFSVNGKVRIVTHHWSDNINKGYWIYQKLFEYSRDRDDVEFVFIGRKFNDQFKNPPPVIGPLKGKELADCLRSCDLYVTASVYDSCPMHVLEGLSCGLPILYLNHPGGAFDICHFPEAFYGEPFDDFNDLINKIGRIRDNYNFYYTGLLQNIERFNSDLCYRKYLDLFNQLI